MNWKPAFLREQLERVKERGWLPYFQEAATKYGLPVSILLAVASRETNIHNIIGDHGHGHGIMQIDNRYYPEWCASGKWKDPREAIRMGAWVLLGFFNSAQRWLHGGLYDPMRGAIAAYNAGKKSFMNYLAHNNPDLGTTGHDYSKDVLARSAVFAELLKDK